MKCRRADAANIQQSIEQFEKFDYFNTIQENINKTSNNSYDFGDFDFDIDDDD